MSVYKDELVGIKQESTGTCEAVFAGVCGEAIPLASTGGTTKRKPYRSIDSSGNIRACLLNPLRENLRLPENERVVQQCERLKRCESGVSHRCVDVRVGTVQAL